MNFQTINKLEKSTSTYEYVSKYVQIYRSYIAKSKYLEANAFKK